MMPGKALARLALQENGPLRWLFGKVLTDRAAQSDWDCIPLRFLEEGNQTLEEYWNELISEYRESLVNPDDAPRKAEDELNPAAKDFRETLDSFVSEIIAIRYLRANGYDKFRVILRSDRSTADYNAVTETGEFPMEVKELRLTASVDKILETTIKKRLGVTSGKGINIALINNSDKFLETSSGRELSKWAQNELPLTPGDYGKQLSDGSSVRVQIRSGEGDLRVVRYLSFDSESEDDYQGLLRKAVRVVREKVLCKPSMTNGQAARKIVAMRWSVPPSCAMDMVTFPIRLKTDLEVTFRPDHPDFEFYVFTDWWTGEKKDRRK